ncbi:hypothetical protein TRFO_05539 [Tritrichomonas foetus]|uniref:Mitochondrial import inner membrane translocase subunit TIM50 n=1 Tax=Tritrichomonas foetus TaxID=1144522 RepID=A0A1J4K9P5_9EUKA|nr:hypothetical protein TRFO_05539 [Tritrichomonas foetus]|eukprot:OHT06358.1 hypothetical protein TRFO_05539 [Tritrichomonas foetus]
MSELFLFLASNAHFFHEHITRSLMQSHSTENQDTVHTEQSEEIQNFQNHRPSIAFDLDHTLVLITLIKTAHTDFSIVDDSFYSSPRAFVNHSISNMSPSMNSNHSIAGSTPGRRNIHVQVRPGARELLEKLSQKFDLFIFTSLEKELAMKIINGFAGDLFDERHCLTRENCIFANGYSIKDLEVVREVENSIYRENSDSHIRRNRIYHNHYIYDANIFRNEILDESKKNKIRERENNIDINRILLIDDVIGNGLMQPYNCIGVLPFQGETDDRVLIEDLLPLLMECVKERDLVEAVRRKKNNVSENILLY